VILVLLAVLFGTNLTTAATRFVRTYDAYDRLELNLTRFDYVAPDQLIETTFQVSNPSNEGIELIEIELRVSLGVHSIGGGQVRPGVQLRPGERQDFPVELSLNDQNYVATAARESDTLDWHVAGRVQVRLNPALEPVWIPFSVRYLPQ
jgi:hypothetical protein